MTSRLEKSTSLWSAIRRRSSRQRRGRRGRSRRSCQMPLLPAEHPSKLVSPGIIGSRISNKELNDSFFDKRIELRVLN